MQSITIILNCYKRRQYLEEQIAAIRAQTVGGDSDIWVWHNQVEGTIEPPLPYCDPKIKNVICDYNFKFHGRFALGLLAQTKYLAYFDDDTIPAPKWFENCLRYADDDVILGGSGVIFRGSRYTPNQKVGWNGIHATGLVDVDLVGHAWFFKRSLLKHLWNRDPISWDTGEDMQFSAWAYMDAGVKTAVPPHPGHDRELWCSTKGMQYGNDPNASHWSSTADTREQVAEKLQKMGYTKVVDR